ncbi:hypothetical protein [Archaeoglobus neptunius]|uniref:hypothetical protein n=1 Tax=Archaeoglobus neptunius TaxID=2798580 RepID=UPI001925FAA8|nr:hypothetical protein [Archaeoglobus neptunius]
MRKVLLILGLVMLIQPVLALEHLTSNNFDQPDTSLTPEKSYYLPGDSITATYKITPKTDSDMELIGGEKDNPRTYTFKTSLEDAKWTISINYYLGSWTEDFSGSEVKIDVKYFYLDEQRKGVRSIEVNVSGKLPDIDSRLENVVIVNVSVEEADSNVLPPLTVKVVNTQKFSEDIQKIRTDADNLKAELKKAGVSYNESDFDEIYSLLDEAQNLVNDGKYLEADGKITQAENKLESVSSQADRLKAEAERDYVDSILNEAYLNLSVTQVALNKIANSKNYSIYVETYAELNSRYDELKGEFDDAKQMINEGKYSQAYEKLTELKPKAEKLLNDVNELRNKVENEKPEEGGFGLPSFQLSLPVSPLYVAAVTGAAVAVVVAAFIIRRRGRGKWDELR